MNKYFRLCLFLAVSIGVVQFLAASARADIGQVFPNGTQVNNGQVTAVVEYTKSVSVPDIAMKWFMPVGSVINPDLILRNFCAGGQPNAWLQFHYYDIGTDNWIDVPSGLPAPQPPSYRFSNFTAAGYTRVCVGNDLVISDVGRGWFFDQWHGGRNLYPGYQVLLVRVHLLRGGSGLPPLGAINQFRFEGESPSLISPAEMSDAGNVIDYAEPLNGPPGADSFSLLGNRTNAYGYNATYKFRASCSFWPVGVQQRNIYLHWRDADETQSYGNQTWWQLWDLTAGVETSSAGFGHGGGLAGTNEYGEKQVTITKNHLYEWRWINLNHVNVIHVWMPFSEMHTFDTPCEESPPIGFIDSCQIESGRTIIYGWAHDHEAGNSDNPWVTMSISGSASVSSGWIPSNNNYRTVDIENYLAANRPGDTRTRWYGFRWDAGVLLNTGSYSISGTVGNVGAGFDVGLWINTGASPTTGFGFPGNAIPAGCLSVPPPPAPLIGCTLSIVPGISFNNSYTPRMSVSHNGPPLALGVSITAARIVTDPPVSGPITDNITGLPVALANAAADAVFNAPAKTATEIGTYNISGSVTYTYVGAATPVTIPCPALTPSVAMFPYFTVTGGDVSAGGDFSNTSGSCIPTSTGRILAYKHPTTATYQGASAEFAAYAIGAIIGFYTNATNPTGTLQPSGIGLTFANTTPVSGEAYAGNLGGQHCITDYYGQNISASTPVTVGAVNSDLNGLLAGATNGQRVITGDLTLNASANFTGKLATFVTGNVYISGNVGLSSGPYASANAVPFFGLFVRGNIFIGAGVSSVDGIYVAQPVPYTGAPPAPASGFVESAGVIRHGIIYTCANGFAAVPSASLIASCSSQLNLNGLVVAKTLKLHRVSGNVIGGLPAETFNELPELYLGNPPLNDPQGFYNSAATLPPVL